MVSSDNLPSILLGEFPNSQNITLLFAALVTVKTIFKYNLRYVCQNMKQQEENEETTLLPI